MFTTQDDVLITIFNHFNKKIKKLVGCDQFVFEQHNSRQPSEIITWAQAIAKSKEWLVERYVANGYPTSEICS